VINRMVIGFSEFDKWWSLQDLEPSGRNDIWPGLHFLDISGREVEAAFSLHQIGRMTNMPWSLNCSSFESFRFFSSRNLFSSTGPTLMATALCSAQIEMNHTIFEVQNFP
jgi:hypothetical protein